jgi:site-specific DNA recombinase
MRVAIYCRVSTDEQELDNQYRICKAYCERNDYTIYKEYLDVISGTTASRPQFNELLKDMRANKFDGILVAKLDRLGRSLQHLLSLIEEFTKRGIHFMSATQNIDTTSSSGKMQLQIMGVFAEFERNLISERTKEARKGKANWGKRGKDKKPRKKRGGLKKPLSFINKGDS